jgi:hypothetical protein
MTLRRHPTMVRYVGRLDQEDTVFWRDASGIRRLVARLFGGLGSAGAAATSSARVADRALAVAKPVVAGQTALRSVRECEHERMQRRIGRTREAYARFRREGSAPRAGPAPR